MIKTCHILYILMLEVLVQSCQYITAWIESVQQKVGDECHVISHLWYILYSKATGPR